MSRDRQAGPDDGIYRGILLVLVLSILAGAAVTFAGAYLWHDEGISRAGTWLALISAGIYVFFRLLGRREMRRRARDASGDADDDAGRP